MDDGAQMMDVETIDICQLVGNIQKRDGIGTEQTKDDFPEQSP